MVKISEIRNIVAGADWYPPPVSLRVLGYIDNISPTSTVPLSAWAGGIGAGYKSIGLSSPQDTPTGIEWESGYSEIERYVDINANCLWRIDFDGSNLGPIQVADMSGFPFEGNGMADKYGGDGFIVLHGGGDASQAFSGHIRIEYNTNFERTHVDIPLYDSGDPSEDFAPLFVDPPLFERSGIEEQLTVTIFNVAGGSVSVASHPLWASGFNFTHLGTDTWTCTFNISANDNLCHLSRTGQVTFQDGNFRSASTSILQEGYKGNFPVIYDPDGNLYHYVEIGNYWVTVENLRTTKFANEGEIYHDPDSNIWAATGMPSYCVYNNKSEFGEIYGNLYNGYVVDAEATNAGLIDLSYQPYPNDFSDDRNWHIPTKAEWDDIQAAAEAYYGDFPALKLMCNREFPMPHPRWAEHAYTADNATSFSAFGSGMRRKDGEFVSLTTAARYWCSTLDPEYQAAYGYDMYYNFRVDGQVIISGIDEFLHAPYDWQRSTKNNGYSIRLIRRK